MVFTIANIVPKRGVSCPQNPPLFACPHHGSPSGIDSPQHSRAVCQARLPSLRWPFVCLSAEPPVGPRRASALLPPPAPALASLPGHGASCEDCEWWPPRVELGPPALLGSLSERKLCAWILSDSLRAAEHSGALLPLQESDRSRTVFRVSQPSAH